MPQTDLTEQQIAFLEKYCKVPMLFGREKALKKREEFEHLFRAYNLKHDLTRQAIEGLGDSNVAKMLTVELARADALMNNVPGKPDFGGAMNQLDMIQDEVALRSLEAECRERIGLMEPAVTKALGTTGDSTTQIGAMWAVALERLDGGLRAGKPQELSAALQILGRLQGVIATAGGDPGLAGTSGGVENAKAALIEDGKRKAAMADLRRLQEAVGQIEARAKSLMPAGLPVPLTGAISALRLKLTCPPDADSTAIAEIVRQGEGGLTALQQQAEGIFSDLSTWDTARKAATTVLASLRAHPQAGTEPAKAAVNAVQKTFDDAVVKATGFDFKGATADVAGVADACRKATALADALGKLLAVKTARQALKTEFDTTPLNFDQVRTLVERVRTLWAEAGTAETEGKLELAVAKLDEMPAAARAARAMVRNQKEYQDSYQDLKNKADGLAAHKHPIGTAIATDLKIMTDRLADAARLSATDLDGAIAKMPNLYNLEAALQARVEQAKTWVEEKKKFEVRLKAVSDLGEETGGRIAIAEYLLRLEDDKTRAEDLVAPALPRKEFVMATQIVQSSEGVHDAMLKLAEVAKDYFARKKTLDEGARELSGKTGGPQVAEMLTCVRALMSTAAAQTTAKDWKGAVETLKQAATVLNSAKDTAATAEAVANGKNDPAMAGIAKDFEAAMTAFTKVKTSVQGKDSTNAFSASIGEADTLATNARAAATDTPPRPDEAKSLLEGAFDKLNETLKQIGERTAFITIFNASAAALQTTLPPKNTDNVIKDELAELRRILVEAQKLSKQNPPDFLGALRMTETCQEVERKANRKAAAYQAMASDRTKITNAISTLDVDPERTYMADDIKRLRDAKKDISDLLAAGNTTAATSKSTATAKVADALVASKADLTTALADKKKFVTDNLVVFGNVAPEPTRRLYAQADIDTMAQMQIEIQELFDSGAYKAAALRCDNFASVLARAYYAVKNGLLYETARATAKTELDKVTARRPIENPFVAEKVDALADRYQAALDQAAMGNYTGAKKRIDTLPADCLAIEPMLADLDRYRQGREAAGKALGELGKVADKTAVEPLVAQLRGKHANAIALGDKGDLGAAIDLFAEIVTGCAEARKTAEEHAKFATMIGDAKALPDTDVEGLRQAITKAGEMLTDLRSGGKALFVMAQVIAADTALKEARTLIDTDAKAARARLQVALDNCADARLQMGYYDQMTQAEEAAQKLISDFLAKPEAEPVIAELGAQRTALSNAMTDVRSDPSRRQEVVGRIEAVVAEVHRLRLIADNHTLYVAMRDSVNEAAARMERHPQRFAMADDIAMVRQLVSTADGLDARHDHDGAMDRLSRADQIRLAATVKADMQGDKVPALDDIKSILARPDGARELDAIVATLDDPAKKKVMRVAFEARFGCKLKIDRKNPHTAEMNQWFQQQQTAGVVVTQEMWDAKQAELTTYDPVPDGNNRGPDVQKFYEVMCDLPPSATLDNDSMLIFSQTEGPAEGSFYNDGSKLVAMREGTFGDSGIYGVGLPHELEEIDDDAQPIEGENITYFSWNTLHEVGHAIDDQKSFMQTRGAALAGWQDYGSNVMPVARAVAGEFDYDVDYVAAYLSGTSDPAIPDPDGCEPEEWERRRLQCRAFVDRVRTGNNPWQSSGSAKASAIDNICYHEAYANHWVSYPLEARKKGVSGYQFRAPGEWFSELYAAYHTGKLNPSHPARSWLETL